MTRLWQRALLLAIVCLVASTANSATSAQSAFRVAQATAATPRAVAFRQNDVRAESISAPAAGPMQVLFADGTTVSLAPGSEMTIDRFAYDPGRGVATLVATLRRGAFRFMGGRTSKTPNGVTLATSHGTVAIEAAGADISLGAEGQPPHFDMIFGGSMTLARGAVTLSRVHEAGYSIVPDGAGGAAVRKTPPEWRNSLQSRFAPRTGDATRRFLDSRVHS